jgi:hypothetical protein
LCKCPNKSLLPCLHRLVQQGRKKLRTRFGRQQLQQLPRLACHLLPTSSNVNKNRISHVELVVNGENTH